MRSRSWRSFLVFLAFFIAVIPASLLSAQAEGTPVAGTVIPGVTCQDRAHLDPNITQHLQDNVHVLFMCTSISADGLTTTILARMQIEHSIDGTPITSLFQDEGTGIVDLMQYGTTMIEVEEGTVTVTVKDFTAGDNYGNGSAFKGERVTGSTTEIRWSPLDKDARFDMNKGDAVILQNVTAAFEVEAGDATITATTIYTSIGGGCPGTCYKVPPG